MEDWAERQKIFLQTIKGNVWLSLLESIPGTCFFLKDLEGRYMGANRAYANYLGVEHEGKVLGQTDFDFHPDEISRIYVNDDQKLVRTGEPVIDLVEPWKTFDGRFGWTVTSKHPVYDETGQVIGVIGVTQPSESETSLEEPVLSQNQEGSDSDEQSRSDLQWRFLIQIKNGKETRKLFERLSGTAFYIKNCDGRFISGNQALRQRLGLGSELELIGSQDVDYFSSEIAEEFAEDERGVLETGNPVYGKVGLYYNEGRTLDWHLTTRLPVFDRQGIIIGVMAVIQICDGESPIADGMNEGLFKATELIKQNTDRRVSSEEMATMAGMSVWQLRRRFKETFEMSPHEYERISRLENSRQALIEFEKTIAEIALDFGFCDQSAFSVQFRKQFGISPKEYRNKQKGGRDSH